MKILLATSALTSTALFIIACNSSTQTPNIEKTLYTHINKPRTLYNETAYIVSQCYTKTEDIGGKVHNPCFNCHINSVEPNYINDWALQEEYAFVEPALKNPWTNLFKDRTEAVSKIEDETILNYVRESNYFDNDGEIKIAKNLKNLPNTWDYNENGKWDGYTPDCYFNFNSEGFDKDLEDNYTGWRAFGYYPFLGTFWPTNGSTDDVMIRLPLSFQQNKNGDFNLTIYKTNLAIIEALIKQKDIQISPVDEIALDVDLDKDGNLGMANLIKYEWKPNENRNMYYVGKAKSELESGKVHLAARLYPEGTEFLHTVRYIDLDSNDSIKMAARMKEVRYGKKEHWSTYYDLLNSFQAEIQEKDAFPARTRNIPGNYEEGLMNGQGWVYQGFIEDSKGEIRPQNYEETMNCIGCHSTIGAIADSTFVFQRKFDFNATQHGWHHWSQSGLKNVKEPKTPDGRDEYTLYLQENHAGNEFRDNDEVMQKFFNDDGTLKNSEVQKLHNDLSHLLFPSQQRALMLNKAYKVIVDEQSFIYGRDVHVKPVANVHKMVEEAQSTGVSNPIKY